MITYPLKWRSFCPYNLLYGVLTKICEAEFPLQPSLGIVSCLQKWLQSRHKMDFKLHFKCYKMVKIACPSLICVMRTDLLNLSTLWAVCYRISCLKQISWQPKYNTIANYKQFDSLRGYYPVVILQICNVSELQRFCRPRYDRITVILRVIGNWWKCACVVTKSLFPLNHSEI